MAPKNQAPTSSDIIPIATRCLPRTDGACLHSGRDAVALICHACMVAANFRLTGFGDDRRLENSDTLPREWNAGSTISLRYSHEDTSPEYLLKIDALGGNVIVYALGLDSDRTTSFDLPTDAYVVGSKLPLAGNPAPEALSAVFPSPSRLDTLLSRVYVHVIQKLAPCDERESGTGLGQATPGTLREQAAQQYPSRGPLRDDHSPEPTRPYPFDDPLAVPSGEPVPAGDFPPPGFEDEHQINRPARGHFPERQPYNIGERDLYPQGLAPHDPLRRHFGPSGGAGGGGMHPTFDDPMFGGGRGRGEGGYDPQVPPGARYDPVGPGDGRPYGQGGSFPGGRGNHPGPGGQGGLGGFGGFGGGGII